MTRQLDFSLSVAEFRAELLSRELEYQGYLLRYNDNDKLELFEFGGGGQCLAPYWERSTGEIFDSLPAAHKYVFLS